MKREWYMSRVAPFFILMAITVVFTYAALHIEIGETKNMRHTVFSIRFDYYGMDCEQIEQLITIPLEEKMMVLPGLLELRSSVEYGKSVTTAYFQKSANKKQLYMRMRNDVDTLYASMPGDVQKPRITSSAASDKAVMCIAFSGNAVQGNMRNWIETHVKKALESVDNVSEVIVAGGKTEEILVAFDAEKAAALNQNPAVLATVVRDGNSVNAGALLRTGTSDECIAFDTQFRSLDDMLALPLNAGGSCTTLGYAAEIGKSGRINDEIVRINGEECITVAVMSSSSGNSIAISRACRRALFNMQLPAGSWNILYDNGTVLESLAVSVVRALVTSFACVIIIIPFFFNSLRVLVLALLFLLVDSVWTVGLLNIAGCTLNQNTIAGISIALGLASDSAFVINETAYAAANQQAYVASVKRIIPSMFAASLTTIIALVPLYFLDCIVPGIRAVAFAICTMIVNAVFLAVAFYPCFLSADVRASKRVLPLQTYDMVHACVMRMSCTVHFINHKKTMRIFYVAMMLLPPVIFAVSGKNISFETSGNVIYAAAEFAPEKSKESIDDAIQQLIKMIAQKDGVTFVRSEARKGTAELEIGYDEKTVAETSVVAHVQSLSHVLSDGFLYVPGARAKRTERVQSIELCVVGDEQNMCMDYARKAAESLNKTGMFYSVVLNFKEPEKLLAFTPSREFLCMNLMTVEETASTLRWILFGPVADKWLRDGTETDIRIRALSDATLSDIENIYIPTGCDAIRLGAFGAFEQKEGRGKIYRKDGRRAAFFTVETTGESLNTSVKKIKTTLDPLVFEKGYGVSFPHEIETMDRQYGMLVAVLVISVVCIFIVLVALIEDFLRALSIVSLIPVSLCIPLLVRFFLRMPLELGDVTGMVLLSGVTVNNAIYIASSKKKKIQEKMREKITSILVTSLTSIAGAMPLLFSNAGGFCGSVSIFMVCGIANSLIASVAFFPCVYKNQ